MVSSSADLTVDDMDSKNNTPLLSASAAAERFHVTNDYISRLCREKKVEGLLIGGVWHVNPVSLAIYFDAIQADQTKRTEELSHHLRSEYVKHKIVSEHASSFISPARHFTAAAVLLAGAIAICSWAGVAYGAWNMLNAPRAFAAHISSQPLVRDVTTVSDIFTKSVYELAGDSTQTSRNEFNIASAWDAWTGFLSNILYSTDSSRTATAPATPTAETPIVNRAPIIDAGATSPQLPIIEQVIVPAQLGVSQLSLDQQLLSLTNSLRSEFSLRQSGPVFSAPPVFTTPGNTIPQTIDSTSISDAVIPDNITASNYLLLAGGILTGPLTYASQTGSDFIATNATTTTFAITSQTSGCAQFDVNGRVLSTGSNCGSGGSAFPFTPTSSFYNLLSNSTSTPLSFTLGIIASSTSHFSNADFIGATSTSFGITSIASGNLLKTTTGGAIIAAVAGTDYITGAGLSAAYPFPLAGNATSTLTQFNGGLTGFASSTIGNGTQTGGLTISGGATTTLNAYFAGNVGIGTTTSARLSIQATLNATPFMVASSSGATLLSVGSTGALSAKLKQLTADYTVDAGSNSISVGDIVTYINGNAQKVAALAGGTSVAPATPAAAASVSSTFTSAATLDSTHFIIAYVDGTNSNHPTAVVGTVSGTTITYGTPVSLASVNSSNVPTSVAVLDSTHFVMAYTDTTNSSHPTAVVGTVSGTTITGGTPVSLAAVQGFYISIAALDSTHFAAAYKDNTNSFRASAVVSSVSGTVITPGTAVGVSGAASAQYIGTVALDSTHFAVAYGTLSPAAVVSSVSGTTITAGTPVALASNSSSSAFESAAALDSTHFVVTYDDNSNSGYLGAVVSSVSGITVTAGASVFLTAVQEGNNAVSALDSTHFVATYTDTSAHPIAVISSVSGTTITGGIPVSLAAVKANSSYTAVTTLDSTHFVATYSDSTNSINPTAVVGVPTAPTVLGMATNAASAGGTVTVASNGIVSGLSGLTAGSTYYWNALNGLTTAVEQYKVGLALSASSILLNSSNGSSGDQFFGDAVFANNFRITENSSTPQGLTFKNQLGRQIAMLDENGNFNIVGAVSASNFGANFATLLGTTSVDELTSATSTATTSAESLPAWAGAFADASDAMKNALGEFSDAVVQVFGRAIYATAGIFDRVFAKEVHTDKLCVSDSTGETCVTRSQLDSLLAGIGAVPAQSASGGSISSSTFDVSTTTLDFATTTPTTSDASTTSPDTSAAGPSAPSIDMPTPAGASSATPRADAPVTQ